MQKVAGAAVLADLLFDEYDGADQNPLRDKKVRERCQRGKTEEREKTHSLTDSDDTTRR